MNRAIVRRLSHLENRACQENTKMCITFKIVDTRIDANGVRWNRVCAEMDGITKECIEFTEDEQPWVRAGREVSGDHA